MTPGDPKAQHVLTACSRQHLSIRKVGVKKPRLFPVLRSRECPALCHICPMAAGLFLPVQRYQEPGLQPSGLVEVSRKPSIRESEGDTAVCPGGVFLVVCT